jgi:uncharacterized protein (DUF427 family)
MGLTTGTGPFSLLPGGSWNFDAPPPGSAVYVEATAKRIRALLDGETIVDSTNALLVLESGRQAVYYFPATDVRRDLLRRSEHRAAHPNLGEAVLFGIRIADRDEEDIAWSHPDPPTRVHAIQDHIAFDFARMDQWFEEDQEIHAHPKDPYHRIDAYATSRHIRVSLNGEVLAETDRAVALFESNLPVRWYLPPDDVRAHLEHSDTSTLCGYKGRARTTRPC